MASSIKNNNPKTQAAILWSFVILLALGLVYFAYLGSFNRYYADDWCYNADFKELGLSQTMAGYTSNTLYSSNRFSLTLFAGLFFPLGIAGRQILSLMVIVFLSGGLYKLFSLTSKIFLLNTDRKIILSLSFLITFFAVYLAPLRYQSFYWISGTLPYTFPILIAIWIMVIIAELAISTKPSNYARPLLIAMAFFGTAFSEAGAAFLLSIIIIILVTALIYRKEKKWAARIIAPTVAALAFAILSALLLLLSPVSAERASRYGEMAGVLEFFQLTLQYSWDFVRLSLADLPLPHLAIVASTALLALLNRGEKPFSDSKLAMGILLIVLISFTLIAASYAPSALIEKNPPHPRTRVIARTTMLTALVLVSWLASQWAARQKVLAGIRLPLTIILAVLTLTYIGRAIYISADLLPVYASRAQIWDERHEILLSAGETNAEYVDVQAIDGAPIGGLRDFKLATTHWINVCAARFYGVGTISGLP